MFYKSSSEYKALELTKIWSNTSKNIIPKEKIFKTYIYFFDKLIQNDVDNHTNVVVDEIHELPIDWIDKKIKK